MTIVPGTRNELIKTIIPPGSIGAEIGVLSGAFSYKLLRLPIAALYMVDPWTAYSKFSHDRLNDQKVLDDALRQAKQYNEEDLAKGRAHIVREYSAVAARSWLSNNNPRLDWVYIDGNHSYEAALEDHLLWEQNLKPGGFIMGHDYAPQYSREVCGVVDAVTEFCKTRGWKIELMSSINNQNVPAWENIHTYKLIKT
jgi:hypothetical protein